MWILLSLSVTLLAFIVVLLIHYQYSNQGLPPGPFRLPIVGNLPSIISSENITNVFQIKPWIFVHNLQKKYGDVFSVTCGSFYGVMLCSYEAMNEVSNLDEWSHKVCNEISMVRSWGKELGLIFVSNPSIWVEMRKFTQRTLRDFGFGKRYSMQNVIEAEITDIVSEIKAEMKDGHQCILSIKTNFILSILNVLWCMVVGIRYPHNDPKLVKMFDVNYAATKAHTFADPIILAFPWIRKLFPGLTGETLKLQCVAESHEFSKQLIEERKQEGLYLTDPQNYVDVFLKKIHETRNDPDTVYTEEQLICMIEDLFQTGTTTTAATLNWGLLHLMLNPNVQRKFQEEIDAVIPRNMAPTLDQLERIPYILATVAEIHRIGNVVPNPIPRIIEKDTMYRGWKIPKGTHILSNHYSVMMDETYWGDPYVFRPERFLSKLGDYVPDKRCVQFGFGKRYCIGVTLVNSVIPVFLATIMQNFTFSTIPGEPLPSTEPEIGFNVSPYRFKAVVSLRN